jgi:hypothetical protein
MKLALYALLSIALVVALGCGKGSDEQASPDTRATSGGSASGNTPTVKAAPSLEGTWSLSGAPGESETAIFNADGTFTVTGTLADKPGLEIILQGTFMLAGEDLTRTFTSAEITGASEEEKRTVHEGLESMLNKPKTGKIEWLGDNELKFLEEGSNPSTWKRV